MQLEFVIIGVVIELNEYDLLNRHRKRFIETAWPMKFQSLIRAD